MSCVRRYSRASINGMSICRHIASLPSFITRGDFEASLAAQSATASSNSSAGTTLLTIPASRASSAVSRSPSSSSSVVFLRGTLR